MSTFVEISKSDLEKWFRDIGFQGKWNLVPGTLGVYNLHLSDAVAIKLSSTIGFTQRGMGRGKASMKLSLVSRITGNTLNKKMGQSHFRRTLNWKTNWEKGITNMKNLYLKSADFYNDIAVIKDREKYKKEMLGWIASIPGWDQDSYLSGLYAKVDKGGVLSRRNQADLEEISTQRKERFEQERKVEAFLNRLRALWRQASIQRDQWVMNFTASIADQIKQSRPLSQKQKQKLQEKFEFYQV